MHYWLFIFLHNLKRQQEWDIFGVTTRPCLLSQNVGGNHYKVWEKDLKEGETGEIRFILNQALR